jgi:magnesium transporter
MFLLEGDARHDQHRAKRDHQIFSVAAVVFLPPTLIASIYGMNFEYLPEFDWLLGYPFALGIMAISAILPYLFFRYRGWL